MKFAEKMKIALNKKGITQSELSRLSGLTRSVISDYARGRMEPKTVNLKKISDALECSPYDLVSDIENEKVEANFEFFSVMFKNDKEAKKLLKRIQITPNGNLCKDGIEIDPNCTEIIEAAAKSLLHALRTAYASGSNTATFKPSLS